MSTIGYTNSIHTNRFGHIKIKRGITNHHCLVDAALNILQYLLKHLRVLNWDELMKPNAVAGGDDLGMLCGEIEYLGAKIFALDDRLAGSAPGWTWLPALVLFLLSLFSFQAF